MLRTARCFDVLCWSGTGKWPVLDSVSVFVGRESGNHWSSTLAGFWLCIRTCSLLRAKEHRCYITVLHVPSYCLTVGTRYTKLWFSVTPKILKRNMPTSFWTLFYAFAVTRDKRPLTKLLLKGRGCVGIWSFFGPSHNQVFAKLWFVEPRSSAK